MSCIVSISLFHSVNFLPFFAALGNILFCTPLFVFPYDCAGFSLFSNISFVLLFFLTRVVWFPYVVSWLLSRQNWLISVHWFSKVFQAFTDQELENLRPLGLTPSFSISNIAFCFPINIVHDHMEELLRICRTRSLDSAPACCFATLLVHKILLLFIQKWILFRLATSCRAVM